MNIYTRSEWVSTTDAGRRVFGDVTGKTVVRWIGSGRLPQRWPLDAPHDEQEEVWKITPGGRYQINSRVAAKVQQAWNDRARRKICG